MLLASTIARVSHRLVFSYLQAKCPTVEFGTGIYFDGLPYFVIGRRAKVRIGDGVIFRNTTRMEKLTDIINTLRFKINNRRIYENQTATFS